MSGRRATRLFDAVVAPERNIFGLLDAGATTAERSLELLEKLVHHWPDRADLVSELGSCRRESEERAEDVFTHVHRTYVTSLDREDVLALSDALEAIVEHAEAVSGLLDAYGATRSPEPARRLTHRLTGASAELCAGVAALRRLKGLADRVAALRALERDAHRLLREGLADLVADDPPARQLLAWKDIYEELTAVVDRGFVAATRALHAVELKGR